MLIYKNSGVQDCGILEAFVGISSWFNLDICCDFILNVAITTTELFNRKKTLYFVSFICDRNRYRNVIGFVQIVCAFCD